MKEPNAQHSTVVQFSDLQEEHVFHHGRMFKDMLNLQLSDCLSMWRGHCMFNVLMLGEALLLMLSHRIWFHLSCWRQPISVGIDSAK